MRLLLYPKDKRELPCSQLPRIHLKDHNERRTWRKFTLCWATPMKRFPFSNGGFTFRRPQALRRGRCALIPIGIVSATILAFRSWLRKRSREGELQLTTIRFRCDSGSFIRH